MSGSTSEATFVSLLTLRASLYSSHTPLSPALCENQRRLIEILEQQGGFGKTLGFDGVETNTSLEDLATLFNASFPSEQKRVPADPQKFWNNSDGENEHGDDVWGNGSMNCAFSGEEALRRLLSHAPRENECIVNPRLRVCERSLNVSRRQRFGGEEQEKVRRFGLEKMQLVKKIAAHVNSIYCVKVDPDENIVATGSDDYLIKLFDSRNFKLLGRLRGHEGPICDLCFKKTAASLYLISSSVDQTIRVWDVNKQSLRAKFSFHSKSVTCLSLVDNGSCLLAGGDDGLASLWNLDAILSKHTGVEEVKEKVKEKVLTNLSANRDDHVINPVVSLDWKEGACFPAILAHVANLEDGELELSDVDVLAVHPNSLIAATGCHKGFVRIWSVSVRSLEEFSEHRTPKRRPRAELDKNSEIERAINFSVQSSGKMFINESDRLVSVIKVHSGGVMQAKWCNLGTRLLTSSPADGKLKLLDFSEKNQSSFVWSFDYLLKWPSMFSLTVLHPQEVKRGKRIDCCEWSLDGTKIITMESKEIKMRSDNDTIDPWLFPEQVTKVWDAMEGRKFGNLMHSLFGHRRSGYSILRPPGSKDVIITISYDSLVLMWDIEKGQLISKFMVPCLNVPASLLDGVFLSIGSIDLVLTDSHGRIILFSSYFEEKQSRNFFSHAVFEPRRLNYDLRHTYSEQYFDNDFEPEFDPLKGPGSLCSLEGLVYSIQPSQVMTLSEQNRLQAMIREKDKAKFELEQNNMGVIGSQLALLDSKVEAAKRNAEKYPNRGFQREDFVSVGGEPSRSENTRARVTRDRNNTDYQEPNEMLERDERRRVRRHNLRSAEERRLPALPYSDYASVRVTRSRSNAEEPSSFDVRVLRRTRRRGARIAQNRIRDASRFLETGELPQQSSPNDDNNNNNNSDDDIVYYSDIEAEIRRRRRDQNENVETEDSMDDGPESDSDASSKSELDSASHPTGDQEVSNSNIRNEENQVLYYSHSYFAREWMRQTSLVSQLLDEYTPQLGDKVVYFPKGHALYNEKHPSEQGSDVLARLGPDFSSCFLCEVIEVSPKLGLLKLVDLPEDVNDRPLISVSLTLRILKESPRRARQNSLWSEYRGSDAVLCFPLEQHSVSEFLILQRKYESCMETEFRLNDRVVCGFGQEEIDIYGGSIVEIKTQSSPWHKYEVKWDDGSPNTFVSPWEIFKPSENELAVQLVSMDNEVCQHLTREMNNLMKMSVAKPFVNRVEESEAPGYLAVVALPIELSLIHSRIRGRYYRQWESIEADFRLIKSNCIFYNEAESAISKFAERLYEKGVDIIESAKAMFGSDFLVSETKSIPLVSSNSFGHQDTTGADESSVSEENDPESTSSRKRRRGDNQSISRRSKRLRTSVRSSTREVEEESSDDQSTIADENSSDEAPARPRRGARNSEFVRRSSRRISHQPEPVEGSDAPASRSTRYSLRER